jgi:uncharacterized membrane protein
MNTNRNSGLAMLMAGLLSLATPAVAYAWTIQDLGDLAGGPSFSEAYGLNDAGDVVGYGTTGAANEAFIWTSAKGMNPLPRRRGFSSCSANGINNSGLVAGYCSAAFTNKRSAMVWQSGQPTAITFNGTILASEALAVNTLGEVSGTYNERVGSKILDQAFSWDSRIVGGVARGITPLPADLGGSGRGNAINGQGFIAGNATRNTGPVVGTGPYPHQPYLWNPAVTNSAQAIVPVGVLPNSASRFGEAHGINDTRQVVGVYDNRGFLWTPGSPTQTVGTSIPLPIVPYDINNKGQVVGVSQGKARLYDVATKTVTDLGALPEVRAAGWRALSMARAINDNGQIAGTGVNAAGEVHAYLLSPTGIRPRPVLPGIRDRIPLPAR